MPFLISLTSCRGSQSNLFLPPVLLLAWATSPSHPAVCQPPSALTASSPKPQDTQLCVQKTPLKIRGMESEFWAYPEEPWK